MLGTGSMTGSLNCGTIGETSEALELDELKGDGIGGVVRLRGESGRPDAETAGSGDDVTGGSSACENGEGGGEGCDGATVTGLRSGSIKAGGVGVADAGGISMTGSSATALAAISLRISASETNWVFNGSDADGIWRTSSSAGAVCTGSGVGATGVSKVWAGIAAAISPGRATIVLYGSITSATSINGVPSD